MLKRFSKSYVVWSTSLLLTSLWGLSFTPFLQAQEVPDSANGSSTSADQTVECEILIVGGGLAGTATAYESLKAGRTVCLTEITDWIGGQISSQGTSALDEARMQRSLLFYPQGYNELRNEIVDQYGELNPGDCWVSASCFLPTDAHAILEDMLDDAADEGNGTLKWFPATVIKSLDISDDGRIIEGAIAIQRNPAPDTPPLNAEPLSQVIDDAYRFDDSDRFTKTIIQFVPPQDDATDDDENEPVTPWYVVEATETGEIVALADVPYRLGIDPRSYRNPSSASETGDPYCTQGFTYTFAMEQTEIPLPQEEPPFYSQYKPYYTYDPEPGRFNFDEVFTYRRIWAPDDEERPTLSRFGVAVPRPGDISMQNWVWGNDYRPGTSDDNLIYTHEQLEERGQLAPNGWMGGLRTETLRGGEEQALGFYYWLTAETIDSGDRSKETHLNHQLLTGLDSPMGTMHGLSKYPYIREARRIIGRPSYAYSQGFSVSEIDISRADFRDEYYQNVLSPQAYRRLWAALAGLEASSVLETELSPDQVVRRSRSIIYPDSVGIAQYAIDFHPCMAFSPPERPGNIERPGTRQGHGQAYPAQIPLRAMIPQQIDNLLIAGKSIAASHIAAAAYRVHSFEWSVGAAAGTTANLALSENIFPYQLVDDLPQPEPLLQKLRDRLEQQGNPTQFPNTSIFNEDWDEWRVW
ncbi:MAG: FAD-dependent oxidoreductase [Elainellaceae cyanobacterium]